MRDNTRDLKKDYNVFEINQIVQYAESKGGYSYLCVYMLIYNYKPNISEHDYQFVTRDGSGYYRSFMVDTLPDYVQKRYIFIGYLDLQYQIQPLVRYFDLF